MTAARPHPSRRPPGLRPGGGDRGSIVLGWLVKLTVTLTLVGIVAFDFIAVGVGRVGTSDAARQVALAGQDGYYQRQNVDDAYRVATAAAASAGTTLEGFSVARDGTTRATVSRTVNTLVLFRLSFTRGLTEARATAVQTPRPL